MKIIPVLDLKDGVVVRGVAGRRSEYRPIVSRLTPSSNPIAVAAAFRVSFGLTEIYIADLDAIAGASPALPLFETLQGEGFALWVDAGLRRAEDAEVLVASSVVTIVAGLETLDGPRELARLCTNYGDRVVFSLDFKGAQLLSASEDWQRPTAWDVACQAVSLGARRLLVLDLLRVGGGAGTGTEELCRRIVDSFPDVEVIAGGGVAGRDDLTRLQGCGVSAVLVASALHDGRFSAVDLAML